MELFSLPRDRSPRRKGGESSQWVRPFGRKEGEWVTEEKEVEDQIQKEESTYDKYE